MSQLGTVSLFLEMDYLRMLKINCSRYKIGYVELMCGESNKNIASCIDRSYDLT